MAALVLLPLYQSLHCLLELYFWRRGGGLGWRGLAGIVSTRVFVAQDSAGVGQVPLGCKQTEYNPEQLQVCNPIAPNSVWWAL